FPTLPSYSSVSAREMSDLERVLVRNNFITDRRLLRRGEDPFDQSYQELLGNRFIKRLRSLDANAHWIDMGAGDGRAIRQFYKKVAGDGRPNVTAVAAIAAETDDLAARRPGFRGVYG